MLIALDTETNGLDMHHSTKPFFVTIAFADGTIKFWEWDVNPETREPNVLQEDVEEIWAIIDEADEIVLQNAKFDALALSTVSPPERRFPWHKVHDLLLGAHLLHSNRPKDLTTLATMYIGRNIKELEEELENAVVESRKFARSHRPKWRITKHGLEDMPSVKKSGKEKWHADTWLPKCVADALDYPKNHPYRTVLAQYSNEDSAVTLAVWVSMKQEIVKRGRWELYLESRKLLSILDSMETNGVTYSKSRLSNLQTKFTGESEEHSAICTNIAEDMGFALDIGKGVNNSLRMFVYDVMNLEVVNDPKTHKPTLDSKNAIPYYLSTLPNNTVERVFIETLANKRACDSALGYIEQYQRYGLPSNKPNSSADTMVLYPWINPTATDTLRFSFSNPNSSNISKREGYNTREAFGPSEDREWWAFDAENIELRIPAYEAEEKELIDLFERPNDPPYYGSEHLLNFSTVYPDIWKNGIDEVGFDNVGPWVKDFYKSTWYFYCKTGDFAIAYGAVDRADGKGTADRAFRRPGSQARLKSRFARKEKLNQKWIDFANRHGYVETIPDKTVNPHHGYPLLCSRTDWGDISPTVPLNYHVQGTAMWWTRKGMVRVHEFLEGLNAGKVFRGRKWLGGYFITLQVHDELDIDMPSGRGKSPAAWRYNLPITQEIRRLMMMGGDDISVPTTVGVEYHEKNWKDSKKMTRIVIDTGQAELKGLVA